MVCGPLSQSALHTTALLSSPLSLFAVLPQERLTHSLLHSTRAGTVRHLSHFLRWTDAQRFSLSNTQFRSFPPPPSPSILQLLEFEATFRHPTSNYSHTRSTTAAFGRLLASAKLIFYTLVREHRRQLHA